MPTQYFLHLTFCRIDRSDPAAIAGNYSSWTTPYSYNPVREMQQDIGLLKNGSCLRSSQLEDLIHCAAGQIKLPHDQLKDRCIDLGLECPDVSCHPLETHNLPPPFPTTPPPFPIFHRQVCMVSLTQVMVCRAMVASAVPVLLSRLQLRRQRLAACVSAALQF